MKKICGLCEIKTPKGYKLQNTTIIRLIKLYGI